MRPRILPAPDFARTGHFRGAIGAGAARAIVAAGYDPDRRFHDAGTPMAADDDSIALTITQESDYAFRVAFDDTSLPPLLADETPPLGGGKGPDPGRLLGAAIGNCLCASLLFALRKFKNQPGTIVARVRVEHARNERKRLRIGKVAVEIALPGTAADYAEIERILAQFEQFCTVTESVRAGIPVEVTVKDGTGSVLRVSDRAA